MPSLASGAARSRRPSAQRGHISDVLLYFALVILGFLAVSNARASYRFLLVYVACGVHRRFKNFNPQGPPRSLSILRPRDGSEIVLLASAAQPSFPFPGCFMAKKAASTAVTNAHTYNISAGSSCGKCSSAAGVPHLFLLCREVLLLGSSSSLRSECFSATKLSECMQKYCCQCDVDHCCCMYLLVLRVPQDKDRLRYPCASLLVASNF